MRYVVGGTDDALKKIVRANESAFRTDNRTKKVYHFKRLAGVI